MKRRLVVAKNRFVFTRWCIKNKINPRDARVTYVGPNMGYAMRGYIADAVQIVTIGFWQEGMTAESAKEIQDQIDMYKKLGTHVVHYTG